MTDGSDGSATGGPGAGDATGSPAEELVKLVAGAQDWLRQNLPLAGDAMATASMGTGAAGHDATVCGWCPLCQFVAVLRGDRPEVSEKVAQAGAAVASALRAVLDATSERTGRPGSTADSADAPPPRVQKIDLGGPATDPDLGP